MERLLGRRRETDGHVWLGADDGERSWFHASDEGLPALALAAAGGDESRRSRTRGATTSSRELVASRLALDGSRSNPFGYPPHWIKLAGAEPRVQWFFPHDNESGYWWQGENARVASLATLLLAAAEAMPDRDWAPTARDAAQRLRRLDSRRATRSTSACSRVTAATTRPTNPASTTRQAACATAITSGFDDEADIAFRPMPCADDKEHSWRWGEQWMPHAAWLLYALVWSDTGPT